ncbi:unnamed protein product [Darwinula stevensoni]|uniref:Uncharacterized protein n=1 Tax=Darwinula stevensoni TaxID=69355 RepID=A0A7R8XEJ6_9CRUS|nr:unnamed protein product [Darwinula stevensoni]CAG0895373.1 unnamed protein product [Darwinula stevensoni]
MRTLLRHASSNEANRHLSGRSRPQPMENQDLPPVLEEYGGARPSSRRCFSEPPPLDRKDGRRKKRRASPSLEDGKTTKRMKGEDVAGEAGKETDSDEGGRKGEGDELDSKAESGRAESAVIDVVKDSGERQGIAEEEDEASTSSFSALCRLLTCTLHLSLPPQSPSRTDFAAGR